MNIERRKTPRDGDTSKGMRLREFTTHLGCRVKALAVLNDLTGQWDESIQLAGPAVIDSTVREARRQRAARFQ